jgi:glutamate-1-semialdehyde 2,1-aminomutase
MTVSPGDYHESDRQIWEEELADFVPQRVFDAHCHMFQQAHMRPDAAPSGRYEVDLDVLRAWNGTILPGRRLNFLVLGLPVVGIDPDAHNPFVSAQVGRDPGSRANRLVTPACQTSKIEQDIKELGFIGLKPYRVYSVTGDRDNCRIHEFLTHEQLELADQLGLWVTMHLSRSQGCADEQNLADLREYTTKRYPRIKWILAHCARSFTYWPIRHAVERLRDMPNIWYDLSAVNNVHPFLTLFQQEDLRRLFYGSDGVNATYFHGKYVAFGRYWYQVEPDETFSFAHTAARPILSIYEQLLAMKQAAEIAELSSDAIEAVFWRNAHEALGIPVEQEESLRS